MPEHPLCSECERRADAALVVEALAQLAGPKVETPRDRRAWELISAIADDLETTPSDLLRDTP